MGAAGDVEQQAVRRIDDDDRRKAIAILGQALQQESVGVRVVFFHREIRRAGARISETEAGRQPQRQRFAADGDKPQRA
jgi:hypothetical protein